MLTSTLATPDRILDGLNPRQREAVTHVHGPLLILAGPGSGKTRVIVHRIAYLIEAQAVDPTGVLAVTFTNKAAREMRERLDALLERRAAGTLTVGTFHAICVRWLRREAHHIGLDPGFAIFDDNDQVDLVKQVLKELEIDEKRTSARAVLSAISRAKSELVSPDQFQRSAQGKWQETVARVYGRYASLLEANHALDFDDLLLATAGLFRDVPQVLERYQERYQHVLVDEFQDTNLAQYEIVRLLTRRGRNLCVVGDEDQGIYSWRSADIRNILNFEHDYPDLKMVVLEQNYRSTGTILQAAHAVISSNRLRKQKQLWTENASGAPLVLHEAYNEQDEALFVLREIERLHKTARVPLNAIAVMYRTNAQSRAIEDAFVRHGVPYRLVGGTRFYERREVKDVLAYLRLVHNPFDNVSLARIINVPGRGIGAKTVQELNRWAAANSLPPYEAMRRVAALRHGEQDPLAASAPFNTRARELFGGFVDLVEKLCRRAEDGSVSEVLLGILEDSGYSRYIRDGSEEGEERWQNILELLTKAKDYDEFSPEKSLAAFLEDVSLVQDVDLLEDRERTPTDAVTLITLHAAKGLEYPYVFLVGLEENVLPHSRSVDDPAQLEEERRLLYVGMTRAMRALYLVYAFRRTLYGQSQVNTPSRFLGDLPRSILHVTHGGGNSHGGPGGVTWLSGRTTRSVTRQDGRALAARAFSHPSPSPIPPLPSTSHLSPSTSPLRPSSSPPPRRPPSGPLPYKPGDRVRHPKFGLGIVTAARDTGSAQIVEVNFPGATGLKKLDLAFAPLERA